MTSGDIILLVVGIAGALMVGLFFLNRKAYQKMNEQNELLDKNKQNQSIYIIDKKRVYAKDSSLPKVVIDSLPKYYRFVKVYLIKAKIGPQIITLICNKSVFNALPIRKNAKVEIAGIYIVSMVGMKSKKEFEKTRDSNKSTVTKKPWYKFWS